MNIHISEFHYYRKYYPMKTYYSVKYYINTISGVEGEMLYHVNGIIQCVPFSAWLSALTTMLLRFISVDACISNLLLFTAEYSTVEVPQFFNHLSANGHLGCFQFTTIINKATLNICIQVFAWAHTFISLG